MVWDATQPADAAPVRQSSSIRQNWEAIEQSVAGVNLVADNTFMLWADGDSSAPSLYSLTGTGASVARVGVNMADTRHKYGEFAAKVTGGAADPARLQQDVIADLSSEDFLGLSLACGAWILADDPDVAFAAQAGAGAVSVEHPGDGQWHWLETVVAINSISGPLSFWIEAPPLVDGLISGPTCILGRVPPGGPQPSAWRPWETRFILAGTQSVVTNHALGYYPVDRPGIVRDVQIYVGTSGPTGADLILDLNTWDGSAYTSMFTSGGRPKVADGAVRGSGQPAGTYARRCLMPIHGTRRTVGGEISLDVDQVGSTLAGRDVTVLVRGLQVARPLEPFLGFDE